MNLKRLLPRRIAGKSSHHRAIFRSGLSYIMSGVVELSSLGKMTTDWKLIAVTLSDDQWDLKRFFERVSVSKPRPWRIASPHQRRMRAEAMAQALACIATGTVEALSLGYVSADWSILWQIHGEEIIDKILERLEMP